MTPPAAIPRWAWGDAPGILRQTLDRGGLLAIPTESSYGLAADPCNPRGVAAVYAVKQRPPDQPLLVVAANRQQLEGLGVHAPDAAWQVLEGCWPAPLTAVLPLHRPLPAAVGEPALAVRIPAHQPLRELLARIGPVTATSANRSGQPPLLTAGEAAALLADAMTADLAVVVQGGDLPGGPPSTLVAWQPEEGEGGSWRLLRPGRLDFARFLAAGQG